MLARGSDFRVVYPGRCMCYRRTTAVWLRSDLPKPTPAPPTAPAPSRCAALTAPTPTSTLMSTGKGTAEGIGKFRRRRRRGSEAARNYRRREAAGRGFGSCQELDRTRDAVVRGVGRLPTNFTIITLVS
jgi:hypothetical protein